VVRSPAFYWGLSSPTFFWPNKVGLFSFCSFRDVVPLFSTKILAWPGILRSLVLFEVSGFCQFESLHFSPLAGFLFSFLLLGGPNVLPRWVSQAMQRPHYEELLFPSFFLFAHLSLWSRCVVLSSFIREILVGVLHRTPSSFFLSSLGRRDFSLSGW